MSNLSDGYDMSEAIGVIDVAYARDPQQQWVIKLAVAPGMTVAQAIDVSQLRDSCPELRDLDMMVGVFGKRVALDTPVNPGDRIEIYRPLTCDPKAKRVAKAKRVSRP